MPPPQQDALSVRIGDRHRIATGRKIVGSAPTLPCRQSVKAILTFALKISLADHGIDSSILKRSQLRPIVPS
ncbi:hypothetical protein [Egbenema bharatensis]|uniref:hypothetical protein n=1 Tax=Egbenema bharatensis TaxID=3463334 RepID=UPI003A8359CC